MSATTSTTTRLSSNSSSMLSLKEMELESYSSVDDTDEKRHKNLVRKLHIKIY